MTLGFSTQIGGQPTNFVEKIWMGLLTKTPIAEDRHVGDWIDTCNDKKLLGNKEVVQKAKIHTIREDFPSRWKAGNKIHFVIGNQTKNRFQFAPVIPVKSVQDIWIMPSIKKIMVWRKDSEEASELASEGYWAQLTEKGIVELVENDGFDSLEDFWKYFGEREYAGRIIHWTDLRY